MIKILAIDDNPDNLTTLKALIADAFPGSTFFPALNGRTGIEQALAKDPDVILLDIVMPGMDGFEVCRNLKENERLRDIPVIFLTALKTDRESRIRALETGAEAFLSKPIDEIELTAQIRAMTKIKSGSRFQRMEKERLAALVDERTRELKAELGERKRAENGAVQAQALSNAIIDSIPGTFYMLDGNGRYVRWNAYQRDEIVGKPEDQMACTNAIGTIHPDDRALIQSKIENVITNGQMETVEGRVLLRGGPDFRWLLMTGRRMVIDSRPFLVGTGIDISESKLAETALRESEERYRSLADNIPDIIYSLDGDGNIVTVNQSAFERYGYSEQDFKGKPFLDFVHPEDREILISSFLKAIEEKRKITTGLRFRIVAKNVSNRWFELNASARFDGYGCYKGEEGILRDITDRKQAEEALQESESLMASVVENVPLMIFLKESKDLRFVLFNHAGEELLGYDRKTFIGNNDLDLFSPEQAAHFMAKDREVLDGEMAFLDIPEESISTAKKGERVLHTRKVSIRGADGNSKYLLGISEDITERKQAREELQKSEEKYRLIAENTSDVISILDMNLKFTYVSPSIKRLTGFTVEESLKHSIEDILTPESLKNVLKIFEEEMALEASGTANPSRNRIIVIEQSKKDISIVWVEVACSFIRDAEQKPTGILLISRDITERKQAEGKIIEQMEELQRWNNVMQGREERMIDLKKEVNELLARAGQPPQYASVTEGQGLEAGPAMADRSEKTGN